MKEISGGLSVPVINLSGCPPNPVNFAGTLFMPNVKAKITRPEGEIKADSDDAVYAIPAIGVSVPITKAPPFWRFGLAAFGVSGLGVDYRESSLDNPQFYDFGPMGQFPLVSGEFTQLQILRFAPAVAFQPSEKLSCIRHACPVPQLGAGGRGSGENRRSPQRM